MFAGIQSIQTIMSVGLVCLGVGATVVDLLRAKIPNRLTFPAMAVGVLLHTYERGWMGVGDATLAIVAAFGIFSVFYFLGWMGAGDVKLLMAFAALGGNPRFAFEVAFGSVLVGGICSLIYLLFKKRLTAFLIKMKNFLLSLLVKELEPAFPKADPELQFPFALPLSISAFLVAFTPIKQWLAGVLW